MLDLVDALVALAEEGTMARAAVRLRLTQSAISKRIDTLENRVGVPLIERAGRRARLTPTGVSMVDRLAPLCAQVRAVLVDHAPGRPIVIGSSPALLSSFLPAILAQARRECPHLGLELHSYRGPAVVERLRAGTLDLAIVVDAGLPADLVVERVGEERMVVLGSEGRDLPLRMWLIEATSLTAQALEQRLVRRKLVLEAIGRVESFSTLVQLARAGFGPALVPEGIALAMGATDGIPYHDLTRPIAICGRPGVLARHDVAAFVAAFRRAAGAESTLFPAGVPGPATGR